MNIGKCGAKVLRHTLFKRWRNLIPQKVLILFETLLKLVGQLYADIT